MKLFKYLPILFAFAAFILGGCTSTLLVKSSWNNNQTVIDGKDNDWEDTMFYIPDAQLTAGVRNDSSNMYIILKATNRPQVFQIMGLGLTVWLDPSGGTGEKFGIHFPLGRAARGESMQRSDNNSPDESQNQNPSFEDLSANELEILGVNENGPVRLSIADAKGIELQINRSTGGLIYELKVPLHKSPDHPYALNANGQNVGIGFESGKFEGQGTERRGRGMRGEGGGEGGGMNPGGGEGNGEGPGDTSGEGMRGGGERRRNYSEQQQQPKQIDFWLKVKLANPGTQTGE
ncbi:MAG TPA: hypothetical protein VLX91_03450 [Candidatus Acidoferrales bacterium]|nr:hypothetical protein [Candidatus Acidoferrales bacterium]